MWFVVFKVRQIDGKVLRMTARAAGPLLLDSADPLGAGNHGGFHLTGCENGARITSVEIAPDVARASGRSR